MQSGDFDNRETSCTIRFKIKKTKRFAFIAHLEIRANSFPTFYSGVTDNGDSDRLALRKRSGRRTLAVDNDDGVV